MTEAFGLLGDEILLAHAKDISATGCFGDPALGKGVLDLAYHFSLLKGVSYNLPVIAHGFPEAAVAASLNYLRSIDAAATYPACAR